MRSGGSNPLAGTNRSTRDGVMADAAGSDPVTSSVVGVRLSLSGPTHQTAFGPESFGYLSTLGEEAAQAVPGSTPGTRCPARRRNTSERTHSHRAEPDVEGYRLKSGLSRVRI